MQKTGTPTVVPAIMRSLTKLMQKKEFAEGIPVDTLIAHVRVFEGQNISKDNIEAFLSREGRGFLRRNGFSVSLQDGVQPQDLPDLVGIVEREAGKRRRSTGSREVGIVNPRRGNRKER